MIVQERELDSLSPPATCHNEVAQTYPANAGYKEVLNGMGGSGITGTSLTFVNPWITDAVLTSAASGSTTLYVYAESHKHSSDKYSGQSGSARYFGCNIWGEC